MNNHKTFRFRVVRLLAVFTVLLVGAVPGVRGFGFGKSLEGSEQLEAYISLACEAERISEGVCMHAIDLRSVYRSTHPAAVDQRLGLGAHPYLVVAISARDENADPFEVLIHQGNWSSDANTALVHAAEASKSTTLASLACRTDLFASPKLFITIRRDSPGGYDFSFALKKSLLSGEGTTSQLIPPRLPIILSVPVQAHFPPRDPQGPTMLVDYDVSVTVVSSYPVAVNFSLTFLGDEDECARVAVEAVSGGAYKTAGTTALSLRRRVRHLDATRLFFLVWVDAPRRAVLEFNISSSSSGHEAAPEGSPAAAEEAEEEYVRRLVIGNRLHARGALAEARAAYISAQKLFPSKGAAAAKIYQLEHGASALETGEGVVMQRQGALFPLVRELGETITEGLAGVDSGRASVIRVAREQSLDMLALARKGAANLLAEDQDLVGARRVVALAQGELAHLPVQMTLQNLWDSAALFRRHGAWNDAARLLHQLASIDQEAEAVWKELGWVLSNAGRHEEAERALLTALQLQGEAPQWDTLVTLAEGTLRHHGCGNASLGLARADRALKAAREDPSDAARARRAAAVCSLCLSSDGDAAQALAAMPRVESAEGEQEEAPCEALLAACGALLGEGALACAGLPCAEKLVAVAEGGVAEGGAEREGGTEKGGAEKESAASEEGAEKGGAEKEL